MSLAEYDIVQIDTSEGCQSIHRTEEYSCLETNIHIRRRLGSYLLQFYFPPIFFVVLSWGAFWIDIDAVVARFGYGIFLLVNMAAQMLYALRRLPPLAYIKAMDIWMSTCLVFICAAMLEYAFIKVKLRNVAVKTGRRMTSFFPKVSSSEEESDSSEEILEIPSVTRKVSEDYIELPAVMTKSPGSERDKTEFTESDSYIELPAITTKVSPKDSGPLKSVMRSTGATVRPTAAVAEKSRRVSMKLARNATFKERLEHRFQKKIKRMKSNEPLMIDIISRFVFPTAFGLFNLAYWSYYLSHY